MPRPVPTVGVVTVPAVPPRPPPRCRHVAACATPAHQAGTPPDAGPGPAPLPPDGGGWDTDWAAPGAAWTSAGVGAGAAGDADDRDANVFYVRDEDIPWDDDGGGGAGYDGDGTGYDPHFAAAGDRADAADGGGAQPQRKRLPAAMRYFDTARIYVKGGDGGKGCVAFRREKFVPKGGPAGGDGGDGGNVYAVADPSLTSLSVFRRTIHFRGGQGTAGGGSKRAGANAPHTEVRVPSGTIFRERGAPPGARPLAEVVAGGPRVLLAAGGRGGRGNAAFKTHKNNAPTLAELGEPGEEKWLDVELRLVADVALVGVPNAGKSTLLAALSAARPKVGAYPFTTLVPSLGVCELDFRTTVFADIPGLVAGAHTGVGLGHEFLRHVSRCRAVVHVVDGSSADPVADYRTVRAELAAFSPRLAALPVVVAHNKVDLPDSADYVADVAAELVEDAKKEAAARSTEPEDGDAEDGADGAAAAVPRPPLTADDIVPVSGATGAGVVDLVRRVRAVLDALPPVDGVALQTDAVNATAPERVPPGVREFDVAVDAFTRTWTVTGPGIDRFVAQTDWNYYESALRFQRVLESSGIASTLRARGVREGDTVTVGGAEFAWSDDRSDGALYDVWLAARNEAGRSLQGSSRWPHAGG